MSALILTLRARPPQRVDLSPLTPGRLRDAGDVARIELVSGNRRLRVGDLFDVRPGDCDEIRIEGGCDRLDFIGRDLDGGAIVVDGDAGACLGQGMCGGRLRVTGSVGPWAAAAMGDGVIDIGGDAGDFLGAALPGAMRGMGGGLVTVAGRAGARAGDRMRRGTIVVGGGVGPYAGSRMIAGTLITLGAAAGAYPGFLMRRGSLLLRRPAERLLPTFADCGTHDLGFLRLLAAALRHSGPCGALLDGLGTRVRRFVGDGAVGGRGEILVWEG